MGFNKLFLPDLKALKSRVKNDDGSFIRHVINSDMISGPADSMRYIEKVVKQHYGNQTNDRPRAKRAAKSR